MALSSELSSRPHDRRTHALEPLRTIVVPIADPAGAARTVRAAASLASRDGSAVHLVHVLEVPRELPLDAHFPGEEREAWTLLRNAQALAESYGVGAIVTLERARSAADAVVAHAQSLEASLLVVGIRAAPAGRRSLLGATAAAILHRAACRVMVVRQPRAVGSTSR